MKKTVIVIILGIALGQLLVWSYLNDFQFKIILMVTLLPFALLSIWALILAWDSKRVLLYKKCLTGMAVGLIGIVSAVLHWSYVVSFSNNDDFPPADQEFSPEFREMNGRFNHLIQSENKEHLDSALILMDELTTIEEDNFHGYSNKISVLIKLKKYDRALGANDTLLTLSNNGAMYLVQRGVIYELLEDSINSKLFYDLGLTDLKKNTSERKQDWNLALNYAEALNVAGYYEKSVAILDSLKISYPNEEVIQVWEIKPKEESMLFLQ